MQISMSNNLIDKLSCYLHNKKEDLSRLYWLMGKRKKVECRICGNILDSWKDVYSPMQCGWHKVDKYNNWICHRCFDHRNFIPFIDMIDETDRKEWEEHNKILEKIRLKAQEVIDLLKEYLPKYKEILDLYQSNLDLDCFDVDGYPTETDFSFDIKSKNKEYVLEIKNDCVLKVFINNEETIEIANYLDKEKLKTCTSRWTWDDAIEVIKEQMEKRNNV